MSPHCRKVLDCYLIISMVLALDQHQQQFKSQLVSVMALELRVPLVGMRFVNHNWFLPGKATTNTCYLFSELVLLLFKQCDFMQIFVSIKYWRETAGERERSLPVYSDFRSGP